MSGFLMILAILSALGGVVLALQSMPYFQGVITSLAAGVVSFAMFAWMAKVLDGQQMIVAALASLRQPAPAPRPVGSAPLFGIGDTVHHAAFGDGDVTSLGGDDGRLLVRFTDGLQMVPAAELKRRTAAKADGTKTCPKCYALMSADANRCGRCGFDYEAAQQLATQG